MTITSINMSEAILKFPIMLSLAIITYSFIFTLNNQNFESSLEQFAALVKFIGYGVLANYIFNNIKLLDTIDVLTYFTFLLACLESAHNFGNSVCKFIANVIIVIMR